LLEDEMIFGYPFFEQRFVKRLVAYHFNHHNDIIILNLLTILKILSIMVKRRKKSNYKK